MVSHCGQEGERARISSWLDSITWLAPLLAYTFGITPDRIEDKNARMAINLNLGGAPNLDLHTAKSGGVSDTLTPFKKVSDAGMDRTQAHFTGLEFRNHLGSSTGATASVGAVIKGCRRDFKFFSPAQDRRVGFDQRTARCLRPLWLAQHIQLAPRLDTALYG